MHGGTFITAGTVNHRQGETGINILHHAVALEALYNSVDSSPQPRCHSETRVKMLDGLYNWATTDHHDEKEPNEEQEEENKDHITSPPICWLHGPAGAGKSAIMQTLCQ
ncbi:hypothetical protein DFH08DRAFT_808500 [Mycena albidolilacea]|uniref:Uncharacterized protein n=1 Tax=Mycena albidolilacea TaxID=1033008 RepID=A0AAD7A2P1_9AGAR|nr:hypothetical protein DFH08DRAFT_808500 [Mycena albidolilacea]